VCARAEAPAGCTAALGVSCIAVAQGPPALMYRTARADSRTISSCAWTPVRLLRRCAALVATCASAAGQQSHTAAPWPGPLAELGGGPPGSSAYLIPRAQPPNIAGFVPNNLPVRPGRPSICSRSPAPRGGPCRRPTPATHALRAVRAAGPVSRPAVGRVGSVQQAAEPS